MAKRKIEIRQDDAKQLFEDRSIITIAEFCKKYCPDTSMYKNKVLVPLTLYKPYDYILFTKREFELLEQYDPWCYDSCIHDGAFSELYDKTCVFTDDFEIYNLIHNKLKYKPYDSYMFINAFKRLDEFDKDLEEVNDIIKKQQIQINLGRFEMDGIRTNSTFFGVPETETKVTVTKRTCKTFANHSSFSNLEQFPSGNQ